MLTEQYIAVSGLSERATAADYKGIGSGVS